MRRQSVARMLTKVSILMIHPNRKGNRGARIVRTTKNAKNRDHGRLLQQREKARNRRRSETDSYDLRERLEVS